MDSFPTFPGLCSCHQVALESEVDQLASQQTVSHGRPSFLLPTDCLCFLSLPGTWAGLSISTRLRDTLCAAATCATPWCAVRFVPVPLMMVESRTGMSSLVQDPRRDKQGPPR